MAITAYVGKPRSGKSYTVVKYVILPALKIKRPVVTNIPIHVDELPEDQRHLIIQIDINRFASDETYFFEMVAVGSLFVLDECWRLFPAGVSANKIPAHHKEFLAEHGHNVDAEGRSLDICFVTQDLSQISKFPRDLVETTYRTVKLTAIGSRTKFRVDVYTGSVSGDKPPKSQLTTSLHGESYDPEVYKFYKSHTKAGDTSAIHELKTDDRGSIFGGFVFKIGFPLALIVVFFGLYGLFGFFTKYDKKPDVVAAPAPTPAPVPASVARPAVPVVPVPSPAPEISNQFRIVGFSGYSDGSGFVDKHSTVLIGHGDGSKPLRYPFIGNCKYTIKGETRSIECKYMGELVTFYSGAPEPEKRYSVDFPRSQQLASNQ